ncbi:MAG: carboxylating nicotinate-nucleotide diphosphorylase [Salinivenus sp.]
MPSSSPEPDAAVRSVLPDSLQHPTVDALLRRCVAEDVDPTGTWPASDDPTATGDVTSAATVPPDAHLTGTLLSKDDGVVAGLPLIRALCRLVDESLSVDVRVQEGDRVTPGDVLATIHGPGRALLTAERPALNLLADLSGVATKTRQYVEAVAHTDAAILDTRKTRPGMRRPHKYAVRQGGGTNHRMGLFDMVLVKENHIAAAGGVAQALRQVRDAHGDQYPIEVEVTTLDELTAALPLSPDIVLLDNMDLPTLRRAVDRAGDAVALEASGGITLDTVADVADTGVDRISVGALTHSAPALDLSLRTDDRS